MENYVFLHMNFWKAMKKIVSIIFSCYFVHYLTWKVLALVLFQYCIGFFISIFVSYNFVLIDTQPYREGVNRSKIITKNAESLWRGGGRGRGSKENLIVVFQDVPTLWVGALILFYQCRHWNKSICQNDSTWRWILARSWGYI